MVSSRKIGAWRSFSCPSRESELSDVLFLLRRAPPLILWRFLLRTRLVGRPAGPLRLVLGPLRLTLVKLDQFVDLFGTFYLSFARSCKGFEDLLLLAPHLPQLRHDISN